MLKEKINTDQTVNEIFYQEKVLVNETYFTQLFKDIDQAKHNIDICTYIFTNDCLGKKLVEVLTAAVKRGVKVRLLIDGIGSRFCDAHCIKQFEDYGIQVRTYHPLPWKIWQWGNAAHAPKSFFFKLFYLVTRINSRNHRKFCLIDNAIVYISSANIDRRHLPRDKGGEGWRDTTVRLSGLEEREIVVLNEAFSRSWNHIPLTQKIRNRFHRKVLSPIFNVNSTRHQRKKIYKNLLQKIANSKRRIWITNAYFVPDSYILNALINAARRNVDVRILLPKESDVLIATLVANTFYSTLLKNNIIVCEYERSVLHAKIIIIDDWYSLGSSNLNSRSLKHDLEIDINIQTIQAKKQIEEQFLVDLLVSEQVKLEDLKKQSFFKNLLGHILLFLRYWI